MAGEIQIDSVTALTASGSNIVLNNVDTATNRTNLGLGSMATQNLSLFTGMIASFAMSSAPTGWLVCNGAAYANADYSDLYTAIGSQWVTAWANSESITTGDYRKNSSGVIYIATSTGTTSGTDVGDDVGVTWSASSNFLVPDLQGAFLRGSGNGTINARTKTGGSVGTRTEDQMQRISGHFYLGSGNNGARFLSPSASPPFSAPTTSQSAYVNNTSYSSSNYSTGTFPFDTNSGNTRTSSATDGETFPYNASVQYCIKY